MSVERELSSMAPGGSIEPGQDTPSDFAAMTVPHVSPDLVRRMTTGHIGALRIESLLPTAICKDLLAGLSEIDFVRYSSVEYPLPAFRVGPVLNEFRHQGSIRSD